MPPLNKIKRIPKIALQCFAALAMALAITSCASTPKLSIPVYEKPVVYVGLGAGARKLDVEIGPEDNFEQDGSALCRLGSGRI